MKDKIEQHLDKLAEKIIKSTKLESPSSNFTTNLMTQLEGFNAKKIAYQPLISKRAWVIVAVIFGALMSYILFGNSESLGWFDGMDLSILGIDFSISENNRISETLSRITISKTLMYTVVLFGILMLVQFSMFKNYFEKRYHV